MSWSMDVHVMMLHASILLLPKGVNLIHSQVIQTYGLIYEEQSKSLTQLCLNEDINECRAMLQEPGIDVDYAF
jgi:hypothetical protein